MRTLFAVILVLVLGPQTSRAQVRGQSEETGKATAPPANETPNDQADGAAEAAPPAPEGESGAEAVVSEPLGAGDEANDNGDGGSPGQKDKKGQKSKKRKSDKGEDGGAGEEAEADRGNSDGADKTSNKILDIGGRLFVRNTVREADWGNNLELDSARLKVQYERKRWRMRVDFEVELAGNEAEVRDAYLRLRPHRHVRVQVGRFKRPMSAVTLTSPWDLPVPERGLLNEFVLYNENTGEPDVLPVGGRADGFEVEVRSRTERDITFQAGVFRSDANIQLADALGENRVPLSWSDTFPEDVYTRASFLPIPQVRVAASLAYIGILDQAGTRNTLRHGAVGGLDVEVNAGPLRAWLEAFYGKSPVHFGFDNIANGEFLALRGIVSARIDPGNVGWLAYVEPAISAQYLNASTEVDEDTASEIGGAVNLGFAQWLRLTAALRRQSADFRLRLAGGTELILQAGAVF